VSARPDDARLWQSVIEALAEVIEPALPRGHARATAHQLQGLARYAKARGADPTPARAAELAALVGAKPDTTWARASTLASDLLVASRAAARPDGTAQQIRELLAGYIQADLDLTAPLLETFARHGEATSGEAPSRAPEADALESWLAAQIGEPLVSFSAYVMSGGHSRRMLDVVAATATRSFSLVVRVEQGGVFGTEGATEARIMQGLHDAGVPVAPILWVESDPEPLGHPFFVMSRVAGSDDPDDAALHAFLRQLDMLHRLPVTSVAASFDVQPQDPIAGVLAAIDWWTAVYRTASTVPVPLLDDGAAWLRRHLHPTGPLAVVHGDPGPGNFLHDGGRVTAITDWEFAHLGDPAEDWVYLSELRGTRLMDAGAWAALLLELVGVHYDEETWRAWTAFNVFKGACANITALHVFNEGASARPNLLAVGTAIHLRFLARLTALIAD
jgi:aminoglycoside phosphotransferase (APT) family kinase protein